MKIFENIIVKLIKRHLLYKDMERERDIAVNKVRFLADEYKELNERLNAAYENNAKQYKFVVKYMNKIIKIVNELEKMKPQKKLRKFVMR